MRLFTPPKLDFAAWTDGSVVGKLQDPDEKFLRIDGQHRRAARKFFGRTHPDDAKAIAAPCVIFDGRTEDFATEMIVLINATPTRITPSHLVDLEERVSWVDPVREFRNEGFHERFPAKGPVEREGGDPPRAWVEGGDRGAGRTG